MMSKVRLGIYVDTPPKVACTSRFVEACARVGFSELIIMIDDAQKHWKPIWTPAEVHDFAVLVMKLSPGTKLGIVTWPWPDKDLLDDMYADLTVYYSQFSEVFCADDSDLEMNWSPRANLRGFPTYDKAGDYLVAAKKRICERYNIHCDADTFSGHEEFGAHADVIPYMDRAWAQLYGVRTRKVREKGDVRKISIPMGHIWAPGRIQEIGISRARAIPSIAEGSTELGVVLPLWDQFGFTLNGEKLSPADVMDIQFNACVDNGITDIRVWSTKHGIDSTARTFKKTSWEWLLSLRERKLIDVPSKQDVPLPVDRETYKISWDCESKLYKCFFNLGWTCGRTHEEALARAKQHVALHQKAQEK